MKLAEERRGREEGRAAFWGPKSLEEIERLVEKVDRAIASEDADAEPEGA